MCDILVKTKKKRKNKHLVKKINIYFLTEEKINYVAYQMSGFDVA